ncbi:MAG: type I restriction enzyme HsdR N-terminal domain-containing protein [Prevotellaceae bacterium]|jgi:hypothetical protein|nr:type I restriction enzyme HsdR N-terminal domain-containing protein [Prevotellaceae bacterium]
MNLPKFEHQTRKSEKGTLIFDTVRRKYVALTPEEWVRQNFIQYLIQTKKTPQSLICVEMYLNLNGMSKRSDIVVFNRHGTPALAVECKAPRIKITQAVFDQLARYNLLLRVPYLAVTNGICNIFCKYSDNAGIYSIIPDLPEYDSLE